MKELFKLGNSIIDDLKKELKEVMEMRKRTQDETANNTKARSNTKEQREARV
jgi:hypothetical protein